MSEPKLIESPIILGAESLRTELSGAADSYDLTPRQIARITDLSDELINAAIRTEAGSRFWAEYDSVLAGAIGELASFPLVQIAYIDGDGYETAVDEINARGGSIDAAAEYLAQWDYGEEDDNASEINGRVDLAELESHPHQLHEGDAGGLHYWVQIDHGLRFYALYRRPLPEKEF